MNIPLVKEYINNNITVLIISYRFTDRFINGAPLGPKIKKYYEENSRNKVTIIPTYFTATFDTIFGYTAQNVASATCQANLKFGKQKFTFYVHVCNPKISTSGSNVCKTFNSSSNAIHEFGHLLDFGHANKMDYSGNKPKVLYSKDPFDAVQLFATYPSLSPPHLYNHGWYTPGEIVYAKNENVYDLYLLRDFGTKEVIKTLGYNRNNRLYFVSYGWKNSKKTKQPEYYLIVHFTDSEYRYSSLDACYKLNKQSQIFEHPRTGFTFKILTWQQKFIKVQTLDSGDFSGAAVEVESDADDTIHDGIERDSDSE